MGGIAYTLSIEPERVPFRGLDVIATGDEKFDRGAQEEVLRRLEDGDTWAWCIVTVTASAHYGNEHFYGTDVLGGCSYFDAEDFVNNGMYYADMQQEARADLMKQLEHAMRRGEAAKEIRQSMK
jgi:hypothetical protein